MTVLTSHDQDEFQSILGRSALEVGAEVERLARMAVQAGADGVVSSPLEVASLRSALGPDALLVTPGIRGASDPKGDQRRTATAQSAARGGSTHLVVGRPVLEAGNPAGVWAQFLEEIG